MPVNMNTRRSTLQSTSDGQLIVPRTKTKAGERALSVAGPLAWNSLTVTVRQLSSLSSFKRHLKTYLFNASFPSLCCKAPFRFLLTLWCYINYQVIIIIIIIIINDHILNAKKCELSALKPQDHIDHPTFKEFKTIDLEQLTLLSAPVLPGPAIDVVFKQKTAVLRRATTRIVTLNTHDALVHERQFINSKINVRLTNIILLGKRETKISQSSPTYIRKDWN